MLEETTQLVVMYIVFQNFEETTRTATSDIHVFHAKLWT